MADFEALARHSFLAFCTTFGALMSSKYCYASIHSPPVLAAKASSVTNAEHNFSRNMHRPLWPDIPYSRLKCSFGDYDLLEGSIEQKSRAGGGLGGLHTDSTTSKTVDP